MKFEILRASDKVESQMWDSIIEALPVQRRDIHFTSAYGRVQERLGCESLLAYYSQDDWFICQPFIKRPIPSNPTRFDLCSPYGYGGPVSNSVSFMDSVTDNGFAGALCGWCVGNRIVTEFCNLHPLLLQHQLTLLTFKPRLIGKDIIVIDLHKFSEETVSRTVRRGVRKARTANARVILLSSNTAKVTFEALYEMSMDRLNASDRWRFPTKYFEAHYDELSALLFHASDGKGERMLMVIGGFGTAYAHFLGSNGRELSSGLDQFLYSETARILRERGYDRFHLGGGTTRASTDKLLAFKSGFSPDRWRLASYTRVFDEPEYAELNARKLAEEVALGHVVSSEFFPLYRRAA